MQCMWQSVGLVGLQFGVGLVGSPKKDRKQSIKTKMGLLDHQRKIENKA